MPKRLAEAAELLAREVLILDTLHLQKDNSQKAVEGGLVPEALCL